MTKGMLITVIHRLENKKFSKYVKFNDVNKNVYYANAVSWGAENGIINGSGDGKFNPNKPVTREEVAVILNNYLKMQGITNNDKNVKQFDDINNVSFWAKDAMSNMINMGIISGKTDTTINPNDNMTRGEVSTMILSIIKDIIK